MTESIYKEYQNKYYNPNDNDKRPGDNDNWKSIQKGFHDIGTTQLETSAGLTLGKGTEDETSVTAAELAAMKLGGIAEELVIAYGSLSAATIPAHGYTFIDITANIITENYNKFIAEMGDYRTGLLKLYMTGMVNTLTACIFDVSTANNSVSQSFYNTGFSSLYVRIVNPTNESITITGKSAGFEISAVYRKG